MFPGFPARISDMRNRFSALSLGYDVAPSTGDSFLLGICTANFSEALSVLCSVMVLSHF